MLCGKMECNVCRDTHIVGCTKNGKPSFEPCRACMRVLGYDMEKDPQQLYSSD